MGIETAAMVFLAGANMLNQKSMQDDQRSAQGKAQAAQDEAFAAQEKQTQALIDAQTKTPPQEVKQAGIRAGGRNLFGSAGGLPLGPTFLTGGGGSPLSPPNVGARTFLGG